MIPDSFRQPSVGRKGKSDLRVSSARARPRSGRPCAKPIRYAFVTVTDRAYWVGTVATVNSILEFHPKAEIVVVENSETPLEPAQRQILKQWNRVRLIGPGAVANRGWPIGGFELKAYACATLAQPPYAYDVLVLIDSDALLCAPVDDLVERAHHAGAFLGGKDCTLNYTKAYRVYGIEAPCLNEHHMSTSLMFCGLSQRNVATLRRWAACCTETRFNRRGSFPGHGDQGILNAILYAEDKSARVRLLDNRLWSQHWTYWLDGVHFLDGHFVNRSARNRPQRAFHCGGTEKFWSFEHSLEVLDSHPQQVFAYIWFLTMFWFGTHRDWSLDPFDYLLPSERHLLQDLVTFLPQIAQVRPAVRADWECVSPVMLRRLLEHVARRPHQEFTEIQGIIALIKQNPQIRRCVELGGYEGASCLALGLRFLNRDLDVFSAESFLEQQYGAEADSQAPSRLNFQQNLAHFPSARVKLIAGIPELVASSFDDGSVDLVVVSGSLRANSLKGVLAAWRPKVSHGGFIAVTGLRRAARRRIINEILGRPPCGRHGVFWWKQD
jgi:hypothetical protein